MNKQFIDSLRFFMPKNVQIEKKIHQQLAAEGRSVAWLCRELRWQRQKWYRFRANGLIEIRDLYQISSLLKHDFFQYYSHQLSHKFTDNEDFITRIFDKFNQIAKKGFASNFLSNKVDYFLDGMQHTDPAWIVNLAYKYSNNVVLRNDYMPYEFTVFVNKFSPVNKEKTVYEEFMPFV